MKLIIADLPSFYKVNLYNWIAQLLDIYVVFQSQTRVGRNNDFFSSKTCFQHEFLTGNLLQRCKRIYSIIEATSYDELILNGWDTPIQWFALCCSKSKNTNALVVESSVFESVTTGWKFWVKRIFLSKISKVYVPGKSNAKLLKKLHFSGDIILTKGVGVFNVIPQPVYIARTRVTQFLYVGRLVEVKNLKLLIAVFNQLPGLTLNIIGFGIQEVELKQMANDNIHFLGAVDNKLLPKYYQEFDVFVLPSKSEPWGLVVEEALNNGMPVIVSDRVGCAEEIVTPANGLVFQYDNREDLINKILKMTDVDYYNSLRKNISMMDYNVIETAQVRAYL